MAEQTAQETAEAEIAEFQSEEFDGGEPVEAPPAETPAPKGESEVAPPVAEVEAELAAEEPEAPPAAEAEPPKKKSVQERINEVTRARREAERRAEAAETELQRLRSQSSPPLKEEPPLKKEAEAADPDEPNPNDYDYGELDPRYIRAIAEHAADQRFAKLRKDDEAAWQEHAEQERQETARGKFEVAIENGSKKHEDFYEKVVVGSEKGEWALSNELGQLALESDVGSDILYHLASNPKEADQVFRSSPFEQARYFGRMEAKFSAEQAAAPGFDIAGKPAPKTPKAPPPIGAARGAGGQFHATADTDDFAEFERKVANKE